MQHLFLMGLLSLVVVFNSCSWEYDAYLRNTTNETAVVDVFLTDKTHMKHLPNKIKVATRIVKFRHGYKKFLDATQNVIWTDLSHFRFYLYPNTTADFTDMAGRFVSSFSRGACVTVTTNKGIDTLIDKREDIRHEKFMYNGRLKTYHYDVKQ